MTNQDNHKFLNLRNIHFRYVPLQGNGFLDDQPSHPEQTNLSEQGWALTSTDHALPAALKGVDLDVAKGDCIILTGKSGCGKTSLLQVINGCIPEFFSGELSGEAFLEGQAILSIPQCERGALIGTIFQNPRSQFFNVCVEEELRFGCENFGLPVDEIKQRIKEVVALLDLERYLSRSLFQLSGGEKQRVACASVMAMRPKLILYDEPSSNLDREGTKLLRESIKMFKRQGVTQIIAEHRLNYCIDLADHIYLMDEGKIIKSWTNSDFRALSPDTIKALGIRRLTEPLLPVPDPLSAASPSEIWVKQLRFHYPKARKRVFSFDGIRLIPNRVNVLLGRNGSGKSTFLTSFAGLQKKAKGCLCGGPYKRMQGRRGNRHSVNGLKRPAAWRDRCTLVFQDVNHQLFTASVREELALSLGFANLARTSTVSAQTCLEKINRVAQALDIDQLLDRHPLSLSGGQKQRLAIGSMLLQDRPVIAFDEPTSGLDLQHMEQFAALLSELVREKTVLLATHDMELAECCDPVIHYLS